jgi:electron transport complex protein RnfD
MWLVCFCAVLAVIQSALGDSGASLIVAGSALCSAILAELLITYKTCGFEKLKDGSAAASALIFSLLLPNQIHPVYAVLGALFAMVVVKYSFGGLGSNWLNPGLGGWLFVRFSWPAVFMTALRGSPLRIIEESLRSGSPDAPMRLLRLNEAATSLDGAVSMFLNNTVFSLFDAELPAGYIDLLIPRSSGIIADRGLLALLAGTIVITAFRISRRRIPLAFLGIFSILVLFFGDLPFTGEFWNGDMLFALFSGGTIAAAFILASDPVSGAKSSAGAAAGAVLGGFLAWVFRYRGFEIYGAFFAVALVNAFTPVIRSLERHWFYSPKTKGETQ